MSNEAQEMNLGVKIAENEKWIKEQAAFQEWLKNESEKSEARCIHIKYQAEFAILKEKISFKIGSRQIDLSFNLSEIDFFNGKTSLEILDVQAGQDFVSWLKKKGLNFKIETKENQEILVIVPDIK
jgi:hypothetical protein